MAYRLCETLGIDRIGGVVMTGSLMLDVLIYAAAFVLVYRLWRYLWRIVALTALFLCPYGFVWIYETARAMVAMARAANMPDEPPHDAANDN